MKKIKFVKYVVLAVLPAFALALFACGHGSGGGKYSFGDGGDKIVISDIAEYTVIRGDSAGDEEKEALVTLRNAINKALSIDIAVSTDWVNKQVQPENEKEIIVGKTNRPASIRAAEGLGYNDFAIKKDGTKIVIVGGSGKATQAAVDYFIKNYIDVYGASVSVPRNGYSYTQNYIIDSLSVDGTDISEYKIYPLCENIDAEAFQTAISDGIVGEHLDIATNVNNYTKYIFLESAHLKANEYGVDIDENGNIFVFGSHFTFEKALEYFESEYFEKLSTEQGKKVNITEKNSVTIEDGHYETYTKSQLVKLINKISKDKDRIIVGTDVDGSQSMPHYTLENYVLATGKYPAVLGIDLSGRGYDLENLPVENLSELVCELTEYASKGGIICVKTYMENPTGNYVGNDRTSGSIGDGLDELLTDGTTLNETLKIELNRYAEFLSALKDNNVAVLFRPFPETGSDTLWYGSAMSDSDRGRLFDYVTNYFVSLGLENLVILDDDGGADFASETLILPTDKAITSVFVETELSVSLVAPSRHQQSYSAQKLLSDIFGREGGENVAILVTKSGTSSIDWIGGGKPFADDLRTLTLGSMARLFFEVMDYDV